MYAYWLQGHSQEFQMGVSINGRMSIKQRSVGVQLQMLTNRTYVNFEFNTFLPNKSIYLASEQFHTTYYKGIIPMLESIINIECSV